MKNIFILFALLLEVSFSFAEDVRLPMSNLYKAAYTRQTRSFDGKPGVNYWTNKSEYKIKAEIDINNKLLTGTEEILYYNNSPDTLKILVVKLIQDIYKAESAHDYPLKSGQMNSGVNISAIELNGVTIDQANRKQLIRNGTNMIVKLPASNFLPPHSKARLNISWSFVIVSNGLRTGAFNDSSIFIGYWYPQMAVYDDYSGWDIRNYTGLQETYNDLADYTVELTLPEEYLVWATGDLVNTKDIYSEKILKRIEASKSVKEVTKIISATDIRKDILKGRGKNIWKFRAINVPDFAFATSNYYFWDACMAVSDAANNKTVWVNAIYPPSAKQFSNAVIFAKEAVEFFSSEFPAIPYPYDKHFSFNGHQHLAVEFPMMANNCDDASEEYIFEITAHEIAHGYMPFYVLSNEREYAWMDEGFVKLFGEMALENRGVKRPDIEYLNTVRFYHKLAESMLDVPLMTPSSCLSPDNNFTVSYAKSANALYFLNEMFKEKGIQQPFKHFFEAWKDKHPTPYDFFFFMNNLFKEDLSWFWRPWYFEFSSPDLAIKIARQEGRKLSISIENSGLLPLSLYLEINFADNTKQVIHKSSIVWKDKNVFALELKTNKKVQSVRLGNDYVVDINPENNIVRLN